MAFFRIQPFWCRRYDLLYASSRTGQGFQQPAVDLGISARLGRLQPGSFVMDLFWFLARSKTATRKNSGSVRTLWTDTYSSLMISLSSASGRNLGNSVKGLKNIVLVLGVCKYLIQNFLFRYLCKIWLVHLQTGDENSKLSMVFFSDHASILSL